MKKTTTTLLSVLKSYFWFVPIIFSFALFLPALKTYFSADDWFHLRISHVSTWQGWLHFWSFVPNETSASFYRPLPTQVFFWLGQQLFGVWAPGFHLIILGFVALSFYLIYRFFCELCSPNVAKWALVLYVASHSHFTRVYFVSAFQEITMTIGVLLVTLGYIRRSTWQSWLLLLSGLFVAFSSKETAVVLPILLLLLDVFRWKLPDWWRWGLVSLVTACYCYARIIWFGFAATNSTYIWNWSPLRAVHTLAWYGLWSFGFPESLIDYVNGLQVAGRFFSDYPVWSWLVLSFGGAAGALFVSGLVLWGWQVLLPMVTAKANLKKLTRQQTELFQVLRDVLLGMIWFGVALLPVLFLPDHKFALYLTLPLVGWCLALGRLFEMGRQHFPTLSLSVFGLLILLNNSAFILTGRSHYSVIRGTIAQKTAEFLASEVSDQTTIVLVTNDTASHGAAWGASKQVLYAVMDNEMVRVLYPNQNLKLVYQDNLTLEELPQLQHTQGVQTVPVSRLVTFK